MKKQIEKIVIVLTLVCGLMYFVEMFANRFFSIMYSLVYNNAAVQHVTMYFGHLIVLLVMSIYALAVPDDRKYIFSAFKHKAGKNLLFFLIGAVIGFLLMGICVLAAKLHGDITIESVEKPDFLLLLIAILGVFLQSSIEEIEARGFVFGKMNGEGVSLIPAVAVSAFFFGFLHINNPGFGLIPMISVMAAGVLFALVYYYSDNIWLAFGIHMMWNYSQDFIFGLPNSGNVSMVSIMISDVKGSSFFYDEMFGIEGSLMAILLYIVMSVVTVIVGKMYQKRKMEKQENV